MDNVIDCLTYIWIPIYILGHADLIPHLSWIILPVVAGLYAYGQTNMKTPDNYFLGFPSYWNIVALYLFLLRPSPLITFFVILIPTILTFIPTRYLYPSKNKFLAKPTWLLTILWIILITYILLQPSPPPSLIWLSLIYPGYYLLGSFYVEWKIQHTK